MDWPDKGASRRLESDLRMESRLVSFSKANLFPEVKENLYVSLGKNQGDLGSCPCRMAIHFFSKRDAKEISK